AWRTRMEPVDALLRCPLFALVGRPVLAAWASAGDTLSVQTGQTLLEEGSPGRHVFVLLRGRVRVSRRGEQGPERSLGVLTPEDVFGEYALLRPHLNTATCRACEPGTVFRLPLAVLQHALRGRRDLTAHLKGWLRLHALVHQLRRGAGLGFLSGPS